MLREATEQIKRAIAKVIDRPVFWSDEALDATLKNWHDDVAVREQVLIYGKRGFWHGDTVDAAAADLPWWKFENVTRLLGGER